MITNSFLPYTPILEAVNHTITEYRRELLIATIIGYSDTTVPFTNTFHKQEYCWVYTLVVKV